MKKYLIFLRIIIRSAWFNFRHLPFHQAIHLPIFIYKGNLKNKGKIFIKGNIYRGMIRLGFNCVNLFANNGIKLNNNGTIVFNGKTFIGNNSAISVSQSGVLEFGNQFNSSTGLKIACYDSIKFNDRILIGWNVQIIDTDFHALTEGNSRTVYRQGTAPINIGNDTWIANGCKLYKGVSIPSFCVVGGDTVLHNSVECPPYSLIINKRNITTITTGLYRNIEDDKLDYNRK